MTARIAVVCPYFKIALTGTFTERKIVAFSQRIGDESDTIGWEFKPIDGSDWKVMIYND